MYFFLRKTTAKTIGNTGRAILAASSKVCAGISMYLNFKIDFGLF
jgi:hypothetical protein